MAAADDAVKCRESKVPSLSLRSSRDYIAFQILQRPLIAIFSKDNQQREDIRNFSANKTAQFAQTISRGSQDDQRCCSRDGSR